MTTPQPAALPELPHTTYSLFYEQPGDLEDEGYQYVLDEPGYTADQMNARYTQGYNDALAALQSQPAAPLRLDQIDLAPLKAELSDPAKAKAFLQKHGFLNASGELAEQYGGKPEQPAAAGVSDEAVFSAADEHANSSGGFAGQTADFWIFEPTELISFVRAILALRPQAVPMTEEQMKDVVWGYVEDSGNIDEKIVLIIRAAEAHHGITAQGAQGGEAK